MTLPFSRRQYFFPSKSFFSFSIFHFPLSIFFYSLRARENIIYRKLRTKPTRLGSSFVQNAVLFAHYGNLAQGAGERGPGSPGYLETALIPVVSFPYPCRDSHGQGRGVQRKKQWLVLTQHNPTNYNNSINSGSERFKKSVTLLTSLDTVPLTSSNHNFRTIITGP
jgi:hypothetical protein